MGSYRYRSLIKVFLPYRSLIEALCTINSPPVVSFISRLRPSGCWGLVDKGFGVYVPSVLRTTT